MKECIICGISKDAILFYRHSGMADGRLNKCIECCKEQARERELALKQDPDWVLKERERGRDKYRRLYVGMKQKPEVKKLAMANYYKKYPEKSLAQNLSNKIKCRPGYHKHHWSYREEHCKDIIELTKNDHAFIHRHMTYDQQYFMYRDVNGVLLDTKEYHLNYINSLLVLDSEKLVDNV
jgi:hypothetical protein